MRAAIALVFAMGCFEKASAQLPAPPTHDLAAAFRELLLANLPDPLVMTESNWGSRVQSVVLDKQRNHGTWRKLRVAAFYPARSLRVDVCNLESREPLRQTFDVNVYVDVDVEFRQQVWVRGLRLWSGSTHARAKVHAVLRCEATTQLDRKSGPVPDLLIRLRVTNAALTYRDLDVVHIAGVGGDAAELLGRALQECVRRLCPHLERELIKKANESIVRVGDTKQIQLSLSRFFWGQ